MSELPRLFLKNNVVINGAHFYPEMVRIVNTLRATVPETGDNAVWITSANDSKHMEGSLHYKNRAFDVRIWNVKNEELVPGWVARLKLALGPDYDVILEPTHIHVEYDPDTNQENV